MNYPTKTEVLEVAERVLTAKQLVAYKLSTNGMSERDIAIHLRISRRAVRDRLAEADVKIHRYLEEAA
jgi:DNA-binding CsgD family transcriptional regulator